MIMENEFNYDEVVMYPGRFQPPHFGHMEIFNKSLNENKKICIAIRNVKPDENNPFDAKIVKLLWEKIYRENKLVSVIIIPNICSIKYGRNVGYSIEEIIVDDNTCFISATNIRKSIKHGGDYWKQNVHESIHDDLKYFFNKLT